MILNTNKDVRLRDGTKIVVKSAQALLANCRRYGVKSSIKRAAIGGEQESGFEQSFASLAYTHIQDKAPGLLDYMIGFQLVDRNEENTKAVGIFGFKIGQNWVYAPVFFLNGDLKGHELLYLKAQDAFVPMKENWINYIINKKPHVLGEAESHSPEQLGILQPDFQRLGQPPLTGKFSSVQAKPWATESGLFKKYAQWVTQNPKSLDPGLAERLDLGAFLCNDVRLCKIAIELGNRYPTVKCAFDHFYSSATIRNALMHLKKQAEFSQPSILNGKSAAVTYKRLQISDILNTKESAGPPPRKKLEVMTNEVITENKPELTEEEQRKALRDGYLIRDHRDGDEVSVVYNTQVDMSLVNPDATCVANVLVKPGSFEKCLIILHPQGGDKCKENFSVIVRLEGDKNWANYHNTNVFIRQDTQSVKSSTSAWRDWFKTLPDSKDLENGATYVIVTENAQGSCVFSVDNDLGNGGYEVNWRDYCNYGNGRNDILPRVVDTTSSREEHCDIVYFNDREGSSFRIVNGKLYCPPSSRVVRIKDPPKCRKCNKKEYECKCDYFHGSHRDDTPPITPGNLADLQLLLVQKQAADKLSGISGYLPKNANEHSPLIGELRIWSDGNEVVINRDRMSKLAGLFSLVKKHGLREGIAKKLLKEAELGTAKRWLVKYAMPGFIGPYATGEGGPSMPMTGMEPQMGMDPSYGGMPTQAGPPSFAPVPGMGADPNAPAINDPMQNIDPSAMQTAQQAASSGQKEIFDTAMIGSMLKAVRQDSLVDRYLSDLTKALDRLGRILFMFYWHNEEFMERYGKQDLPELEDTLRNAFETLGDLTLFLKQKTVDPFGGEEQMGEPELENAAG